MAETLRAYYGTSQVSYDFDSTVTVTASAQHYASTDALVGDVTVARIAGGMHFRTALVDGAELGRSVAAWTLSRQFQPR